MGKKDIELKTDEKFLITEYANKISGDIIARSDCKMCSSPLRKQVEKKFVNSKSYTAAFKILEKAEADISYGAMRRHLINHFIAQERALMVKDYSSSLLDMLEQKYDRRQQLVERIKIMQRRLYMVEAMAESLDFYDTLKAVDAVKKICDTITTHEKEVATMDTAMEPVDLLIINLKNIVQEKLRESPDQEVKDALMDVFNKLTDSVDGILVRKE